MTCESFRAPSNVGSTTNKPTAISRVYFLTFIVVLPTILAGVETCYSSIALPQMSLTVGQASWFAAGPGLAAALGALVFGSMLDAYGRKITLILSSFIPLFGWALIYYDANFLTIFCGRLLTGFPATFVGYVGQVYIVECLTVNNKELRDSLRTWPTVGFALGQLLTFLLGAFVNHITFSAFSAILSLVLIVLMFIFVIESPSWLYQKGRVGDAEVASKRLRITQPILEKALKSGSEIAPSLASLKSTDSNLTIIFEKFKQQNVYKPALIMMVVYILALLTGGMALNSYMVNIIDATQPGLVDVPSATGIQNTTTIRSYPNDSNSFEYSVVSGLLMLAGSVLLSFVLPLTGARKLTISSAVCMCICMFLIGYSNSRPNPSDLSILRLVCVWLISFIYSLGIITVPFSILSAMFPLDAKGFASLPIVMQVLAAFAVSATYPYMYLLSNSGVFYGYSVMCILYAIFVYVFMPETVGRNYEQISSEF